MRVLAHMGYAALIRPKGLNAIRPMAAQCDMPMMIAPNGQGGFRLTKLKSQLVTSS
jgi:hypothetical protein